MNKLDMMQDIERVLIPEEEIHARIREIGAQISEEYRGRCPILVGVLKGVVPFFAEMATLCESFLLDAGYELVMAMDAGRYLDDRAKFRARSGDRGLSEKAKLLLQFGFAIAFALLLVSPWSPLPDHESTAFYVPFLKAPLWHSAGFIVPFVALFVVLVSNSVNLADGLDGLATVPSVFVLGVLGVFAYILGNAKWSAYLFYPFMGGAGELGVFCSAFVGAGIGFLWYNAYPAEIFMGDTGSLAIGGSMAVTCVLLKQELLFPLLGGLFAAEAFTSQVQDKVGVRWLGRRLFYRAPLHHALQYRGMAETKVVIRLWIVAGILGLLALATIKVR